MCFNTSYLSEMQCLHSHATTPTTWHARGLTGGEFTVRHYLRKECIGNAQGICHFHLFRRRMFLDTFSCFFLYEADCIDTSRHCIPVLITLKRQSSASSISSLIGRLLRVPLCSSSMQFFTSLLKDAEIFIAERFQKSCQKWTQSQLWNRLYPQKQG